MILLKSTLLLAAASLASFSAFAQESSPPPAATSGTASAEAPASPKGPTEIVSTVEASFDQKTRKAIFIGDVHVKDPQFNLRCEKLTAFLKNEKSAPEPEAKPREDGSVVPSPGASGLEKAIVEGKVVIVAERPGEKEGETTRYVARSARADFDAKTGDMKLTGWPQVQQGINTHVATEADTVMIINRDGRMQTNGRSKTVIQEEPKEQLPKQSATRP